MTWDHGVAIEHRQAFCNKLESEFRFLKSCSYHWKIKKLAIKLYPHFWQMHSYPEQWIKSQSPTKVSPLVVDVDMHISANEPQPCMNLVKKQSASDLLTGMHRHTKKAKPSGKPNLLIHDPM